MTEPQLGLRIRRVRRRLGWTLQDVADRCGCTRSLLSKIENSHTVPPVATLMKIGEALGVSASSLLEDESEPAVVLVRGGDAESKMIASDKGYDFAMLASGRSRKLMQPVLFEARAGEVVPQPLKHAGEEFVYVIDGRMRYRVGSTEYTLGRGDGLYFDAEQPHELTPLTKVVRFLAVFTEAPKPAGRGGRSKAGG